MEEKSRFVRWVEQQNALFNQELLGQRISDPHINTLNALAERLAEAKGTPLTFIQGIISLIHASLSEFSSNAGLELALKELETSFLSNTQIRNPFRGIYYLLQVSRLLSIPSTILELARTFPAFGRTLQEKRVELLESFVRDFYKLSSAKSPPDKGILLEWAEASKKAFFTLYTRSSHPAFVFRDARTSLLVYANTGFSSLKGFSIAYQHYLRKEEFRGAAITNSLSSGLIYPADHWGSLISVASPSELYEKLPPGSLAFDFIDQSTGELTPELLLEEKEALSELAVRFEYWSNLIEKLLAPVVEQVSKSIDNIALNDLDRMPEFGKRLSLNPWRPLHFGTILYKPIAKLPPSVAEVRSYAAFACSSDRKPKTLEEKEIGRALIAPLLRKMKFFYIKDCPQANAGYVSKESFARLTTSGYGQLQRHLPPVVSTRRSSNKGARAIHHGFVFHPYFQLLSDVNVLWNLTKVSVFEMALGQICSHLDNPQLCHMLIVWVSNELSNILRIDKFALYLKNFDPTSALGHRNLESIVNSYHNDKFRVFDASELFT